MAWEIFCHRFFSPSGISSNNFSSKCCSETDQACLYVSGFVFVFAFVSVLLLVFGRCGWVGWKEGGDDARRERFPNFIGCIVSVIATAVDDGVGGSIVTSAPSLTVVLDCLLLVGVESVKSALENFADGRRERVEFAVVWVWDVVCCGNGGGVGVEVGEAKGNGSNGAPGILKSIVEPWLWRPPAAAAVRRRVRGLEGLTAGVEMDVELDDVGVGKKTPFEPRGLNCTWD